MLGYTPWPSCPGGGWTDVTGTYGGRVIKAVISSGSPGGGFGSPTTTDVDVAHTHSSWSARISWPGKCNNCDNFLGVSCGGNNPRSMQGNFNHGVSQGNAGMSNANSNIPFISLTMCRYDGAAALDVATGLVQFFEGTSCPGGTSEYGPAANRFVVIGSGGGAFLSVSPTPAAGNGADTGFHTHDIAPTYLPTRQSDSTGGTGCGSTMSQPQDSTWVHNSPLVITGLHIPYKQVMMCQITTATVTSKVYPDREVYFFSATPTCPGTWQDLTARGGVYSNSAGRILWTRAPSGSAGSTRGGSQFSYAIGTGTNWNSDPHSHSASVSGFSFPPVTDPDTCCSGGNKYADYSNYAFTINSYGPNEILLPYIVMRGCVAPLPTKSPTAQPSRSPSTSKPSKSPTTSFPTFSPSKNPWTSKPSRNPTHKPSKNPTTSKPSRSPSTSKPSKTPTTSIPTLAPSFNPTLSPTPAPQWVNVCTPGDQKSFKIMIILLFKLVVVPIFVKWIC